MKQEILNRFLVIFCAVDHLIFALVTMGNCVRGETISAASWSLELDGKWQGRVSRRFVDFILGWLQSDHCYKAWRSEQYLRDAGPTEWKE